MAARRKTDPVYVDDRSDAEWLHDVLARAVAEKWCISNYCTTCGSFPLRVALGWAEKDEAGRFVRRNVNEDEVQSILRGLRHCRPGLEPQYESEQAVRWVLLRIWNQFGDEAHVRLFPSLEGTWSADVLSSMRRHWNDKLERRRMHDARQNLKQRDKE